MTNGQRKRPAGVCPVSMALMRMAGWDDNRKCRSFDSPRDPDGPRKALGQDDGRARGEKESGAFKLSAPEMAVNEI